MRLVVNDMMQYVQRVEKIICIQYPHPAATVSCYLYDGHLDVFGCVTTKLIRNERGGNQGV